VPVPWSITPGISEQKDRAQPFDEGVVDATLPEGGGAVSADARVVVEYRPAGPDPYAHMAIHPYPAHLVSPWQLPDGTDVVIRPIRSEDAGLVQDFVARLSDEARFFRFMNVLQELSGPFMVRLTQFDYSEEIALLAVTATSPEEELGVARFSVNPDEGSCEFAIVLADRVTGKGRGQKLLSSLIEVARSRGLKRIGGEVLATNYAMLRLAQTSGFAVEPVSGDPDVVGISLQLEPGGVRDIYPESRANMSARAGRSRVDYAVGPTTLSIAAVACTRQGICWLALDDDGDALIAAMLRRCPGARRVVSVRSPTPESAHRADPASVEAVAGEPDGALLAKALQAIERPGEPFGLPLDLRGTPFQLAVWAQLQRIPVGGVIAYAELARRVGRPRAYRAVAQACGANPVGVLVPCHRVIASDGSLGGFGFGLACKRELLRREGAALQTPRCQPSAPDSP
jgi:O-6-methylguanine DNA methyltransferase